MEVTPVGEATEAREAGKAADSATAVGTRADTTIKAMSPGRQPIELLLTVLKRNALPRRTSLMIMPYARQPKRLRVMLLPVSLPNWLLVRLRL